MLSLVQPYETYAVLEFQCQLKLLKKYLKMVKRLMFGEQTFLLPNNTGLSGLKIWRIYFYHSECQRLYFWQDLNAWIKNWLLHTCKENLKCRLLTMLGMWFKKTNQKQLHKVLANSCNNSIFQLYLKNKWS